MKPSENIFFLIQSLTKTEKAYFNKFAQRHGINANSNYLKLFKSIAAQKQYDEKALAKKFAGTQLATQIHVYKNYLYKLILRSLHNYYSGSTATSRISEQIHYSEILKERGLFNQAKKVLEQAKEIAEKYEHKELLLDILRREVEMLTGAQEFTKDSENEIKQAHQKTLLLLKQIELVSERNQQAAFLRIGMRTKGLYNIEHDLDALKIPAGEDKQLSSFDSLKLYYYINGVYAKSQDEFAKSIEYFRKILELFSKNEHQVEENLQFYISCLYQTNLTSLQIKDEKSYQYSLKELEKLETRLAKEARYNVIGLRIQMMRVEAEAFYCYQKCAFAEIKSIADDVKKSKLIERVEEYGSIHGQEFLDARKEILIFYLGLFLLEGGYYKESINWLNKLAASKGDIEKSGPKLFSKLVIVIAYFEVKDHGMLAYAAKHFLRIISKSAAKYKFEKIFVESLLKLYKAGSGKEKVQLYGKLKDSIQAYSVMKDFNQSFHYFDFLEWIEAKIQAKPMAEILSAKSK